MKRILTASILIPLFVYLVAWAPPWALILSVAALGLLAFHEYGALVAGHGIQPPGVFGYAAGLAILLLPPEHLLFAFLVLAAVLGMGLSLRSRDVAAALPSSAALVLGVVYIFGSLRCAIDLHAVSNYWLLFALSLNWIGDIAALYVGRAFGRHKLAPRISPGKTWEGAIASVIASTAYAAVFVPRLLPGIPLPEALAVAAIGNIAGQIGDLSESALKRGAHVKDSGSFLPGHGGWLDRIDSCLFGIPVIYFLVANLRFRL